MRLPLRRAGAPDEPADTSVSPPTSRSHRAGRRPRLVALGAAGALAAAAVTTYVVLDRPGAGPGQAGASEAATIHSTGSTFIDLPKNLRAPSTRSERRERRPVASPQQIVGEAGSRRLVIPALGVDSPIVPIVSAGGTLTPPGDAQQVGWWASGAEPGAAVGSALVTGHTLSRGGAALQDLETLEIGDRIAVRTADGEIDYRVSDVQIFDKGTIATRATELFSQTAPGRLVVITCEDYNGSTYLSNVVVTATPIGSPSVDF